VRPGHISPYLSIHGDWDQFISSKNKKFRYKVRTGITDLQAAGTVSERWFDTAAATEEFLTDMLSIEAHSWKAPVGMAVRAQEMEHEYYRLLLPFLAAQRALQANVMYLDSIPVAYSLCYLSHGRARQLKTSFDERFASLSPGAVAHQHSIKRAFEIGATEFDFLGDVMSHKNQWATAVREHESIYLFLPNWRGRIVGRARQLVHRLRTRIQ
jgi:CelD/BcsL family acetyltransferase involved in cellulose biosynthesis